MLYFIHFFVFKIQYVFFHKHLLKIQNHGKEGAFPRFLNFFLKPRGFVSISMDFRCRYCKNVETQGGFLGISSLQRRSFMETLLFNLQISSKVIGFPQFFMVEIYVQIPEFVDRETNVRRKCSMVLHGNKIFPSSFWPYFCR